MATYYIDEDGNEVHFARYERSGVLTLLSIFPNGREAGKLIKTKKKINIKKVCNTKTTATLTREIFIAYLRLLLRNVADGNVVMFPGKTGAYIGLKKIPDKEVRLLRSLGKYTDIDIIKSGFTIPKFAFDFGPKYARRDRRIYVTKEMEDRAFRNAEQRKIKWIEFRKILR